MSVTVLRRVLASAVIFGISSFSTIPDQTALAAVVSATWTAQNSNTTAPLYDVSCPARHLCFAAGGSGTIIKTVDGGASWIELSNPRRGEAFSNYMGLSCPSTTRCYAVGEGYIVSSSDSGATWIIQASLGPRGFGSVSCGDELHCIVTSYRDDVTVSTSDGGRTWVERAAGISSGIGDISCPTVLNCFATAPNGVVLATTNGGTSWTQQALGITQWFSEISCSTSSTCVAVGPKGAIARTSNGGLSWISALRSSSEDLLGLSCPTSQTCFASGKWGGIIVTRDGGSSWSDEKSGTPYALNAVGCADQSQCFAASDRGAVHARSVRPESFFVSTAAGSRHNLIVSADGSVWSWGSNVYGQLGDGTMVSRGEAAPVIALGRSVVAVAAGYSHSAALKGDGTVWTWGYNADGELGDGTTSTKTAPVQVSQLNDVVQIAAGWYHTLAIKADGTVWAWGDNQYGQLGDGSTTDRLIPRRIYGAPFGGWVGAGALHSIGIAENGALWTWGNNYNGQLGDGTTTRRLAPVEVPGLTGMVAAVGGLHHSLALGVDGSVWSWGGNSDGQLGTGSFTSRLTPGRVDALAASGAVIAAGALHSLATTVDGTVWGWGYNGQGQLGQGTGDPLSYSTATSPIPVEVTGVEAVRSVAAGEFTSLAVAAGNIPHVWGFQSEPSTANANTDRPAPVVPPGPATEPCDEVASTQNHHIATDKHDSEREGGPWTSKFQSFFDNAGLKIRNEPTNLVRIAGHKGPHPKEYHQAVYDALQNATVGKIPHTPEYTEAVKDTLRKLANRISNKSDNLNYLVTHTIRECRNR